MRGPIKRAGEYPPRVVVHRSCRRRRRCCCCCCCTPPPHLLQTHEQTFRIHLPQNSPPFRIASYLFALCIRNSSHKQTNKPTNIVLRSEKASFQVRRTRPSYGYVSSIGERRAHRARAHNGEGAVAMLTDGDFAMGIFCTDAIHRRNINAVE